MNYVLKQKFWSLSDTFKIRDLEGRDLFVVKGRFFSLGDKLSFQDLNGQELIFIRQKLMSWGPTYYLEQGGRVVAEVRKHLFTFFHCKFTVDVPGPDDFEARGGFLDHEYTFTRSGETVATSSKRWLSWTDTYAIDIPNDNDAILLLAAAVVIDLVCHQNDRKH